MCGYKCLKDLGADPSQVISDCVIERRDQAGLAEKVTVSIRSLQHAVGVEKQAIRLNPAGLGSDDRLRLP